MIFVVIGPVVPTMVDMFATRSRQQTPSRTTELSRARACIDITTRHLPVVHNHSLQLPHLCLHRRMRTNPRMPEERLRSG